MKESGPAGVGMCHPGGDTVKEWICRARMQGLDMDFISPVYICYNNTSISVYA